ncbi:hypothetical protein H6802_00705 [Candidatus Nomurabacteria bacterium]|nr:hypothetical protein [Candidatus Nomurabacteria bacterium]MCB9827751.1 hypothetical protein [Candidatus Nomurabacteria bacterium]
MTRKFDASTNDSHFLSYDIGLAAALATLHFELISLNRDNPRKIGFIFSRTPELEQATQEYFAGRLSVDARSFFENIKMPKNRIFSSAI